MDGADGVSPDQELQSIDARGASATGYADSIKQWLHDERFNYENVEEVDVLTLAHQTRNLDEPDLRHRAIIRAIKSEGGFTHEVAFNHYGNGGTVLHLSGPNQTFAVDPSSKIKRSGFGHEGFKISFTTRKGARLTTAEQNDMAHAIAFDWSQQVFNTEDYIGLVKDGHTADFYFRIIPEVKGFGLNYESVDVSGGMAGLL